MNKEIKRIFIVLSLFSFAGGLFYNFQQLWLLENNLSVKTIGIVLSLGALLSVSTIFLCSNLVKQNKLKKLVSILLLLKALTIVLLFCLNNSGLNVIIKFLTMLDYVLDVEIYASIYPMISIISQDDKLYAKRGLFYSTFYYISVLLTGFLLGKKIFNFTINYNFYLLLTAIFIFSAFFILNNTNVEKYCKNNNDNANDNEILFKLIKKIKTDIISKNYLSFVFFGDIAYYIVQSLLMIILTKYVGYSPTFASNFILVLGIIAVILATLALEKFTFKNNYLNLFLKYGIRLINYIVAVILCNKVSYLFSMIYLMLSTECYTHVSHAPYINRFNGEYQFAFSNLSEIISYLARSIGTLLCSLLIEINLKFVFAMAIVFTTLQIVFAMNALRLRNKESMM